MNYPYVEHHGDCKISPCIHGDIDFYGKSCECDCPNKKAPKKCPIYKNNLEWNIENCQFFESTS